MVFLCALVVILVWLALEWRGHGRRVAAIPLRVHVHGTRGKTTLTREIAARLRARGMPTLARTTGDAPELVLPDGSIVPWKRRGLPRIGEYLRFFRLASHLRCQAVVVECMALHPENIATAARLIRANALLITNTRPDHQEVMGETHADIACAFFPLLPPLGWSAAEKTLLILGEDEGAPLLAEEAERRACQVIRARGVADIPPWRRSAHLADILENALPGFMPGISDTALTLHEKPSESVQASEPVLRPLPGCRHLFLDLFSVNDVESAAEVLASRRGDGTEEAVARPWVALLATRQDRPLRTRAFASWLAAEEAFSRILPVGGHACYARFLLPRDRRVPLPPRFLLPWPMPAPRDLLAALEECLGPCVLVGVGNTHGYGERFRMYAEAESCS